MDILKVIKQVFHRRRVGSACKFGKDTTIDLMANFEGGNTLGNHSLFLNSYMGFGTYIAEKSFIKNTVIGRNIHPLLWGGYKVYGVRICG